MEEPGGMESGLTVKNLQHHFRAFILHRARLASESLNLQRGIFNNTNTGRKL
jgi:hypothetical protein